MGEAKRRRESDPNFGHVPKRPDYRGLIVCPPIEVSKGSLKVRQSSLHPQELRFALLFWDRLVWPTSRVIYFASGPDEEFLEQCGILTRPDYTLHAEGEQGIAIGQVRAFLDRDRIEPGVWAISTGENSLIWKDPKAWEIAGATMELHRAIPIPAHDVPLADILEFRQHRRDELLALRSHLERFVADVEGADDPDEALHQHLQTIDAACADLVAVGRQWQSPIVFGSLKTSFNLSPGNLVKGALTGWDTARQHGLSATGAAVSAAIGAAVSTIEIKREAINFRPIRAKRSPYRYAYSLNKTLT